MSALSWVPEHQQIRAYFREQIGDRWFDWDKPVVAFDDRVPMVVHNDTLEPADEIEGFTRISVREIEPDDAPDDFRVLPGDGWHYQDPRERGNYGPLIGFRVGRSYVEALTYDGVSITPIDVSSYEIIHVSELREEIGAA